METLNIRTVLSTLQQVLSISQPSATSGTSKYVKGDFFDCLAQKKQEYVRKDNSSTEQSSTNRDLKKADEARSETDNTPTCQVAAQGSDRTERESLYQKLRDLLKDRAENTEEKPETEEELVAMITSLLSQAAAQQAGMPDTAMVQMPEQFCSLAAAGVADSAASPAALVESMPVITPDVMKAQDIPAMTALSEQIQVAEEAVPQATSGLTSDAGWIQNSEKESLEAPLPAVSDEKSDAQAQGNGSMLLNEVMKAVPPALRKQLAEIIQKITVQQGSVQTGLQDQKGTVSAQSHQEPILSRLLEDVTKQALLSAAAPGKEEISAINAESAMAQAAADTDISQIPTGLASGITPTAAEVTGEAEDALKANSSDNPLQVASAETTAASASVQPKDKSHSESPMARVHIADLIKTLKDKLPDIAAGRNLQIRLDPPNLGEIEISVSMENQKMSIQFNVNSSLVKNLLQENMPQLIESCARRGIDVGSFDVNQNPGQQQENAQQSYLSHKGRIFTADAGETADDTLVRSGYMENRLVSILV